MSLQVDTAHHGPILIARVSGELDHHSAPIIKEILENEMMNQPTKHLLLNLKHLVFMDSSGIGMILGRYKQILQKSGKMGICEMNPAIYRLLEMSGLFKIVIVGQSEQEVIANLEVVSE
jgi:stage II sporulation protein AA (anti-sigma F factor antagonist)